MGTKERPWYFWPIIAFVVGLFIGWLVIGWGLWPVTWTNATVQDLRPELRQDYVRMVAESYERTGNLELARQRLAGWSQEDLANLLTETQTVLVARDPAAAASVQKLAVGLGATQAAAGAAGQAPAAQQPAAAPAAAETGPSRLRQICTAGIFLILALGALVALVLLFRRWRDARSADELEMAPPETGGLSPQSQAALAAEQEKLRPLGPAPDRSPVGPATTAAVASSQSDWGSGDNSLEPAATTARPPAARPVGPAPAKSGAVEPLPPAAAAVVPAAKPAGNLQLLIDNTAMYQMGEPDYDEAFDINDPVDGYMGQCGLQLIEPFGRDRDQAVALQVWLWDSSDPDTQTRVLMSEGAYRDTALRSQYSGEHEAMSVRPGTEFELASHDLLLKGRVEKVSYAEMEPVRGVFAALQVKMTVYRRS